MPKEQLPPELQARAGCALAAIGQQDAPCFLAHAKPAHLGIAETTPPAIPVCLPAPHPSTPARRNWFSLGSVPPHRCNRWDFARSAALRLPSRAAAKLPAAAQPCPRRLQTDAVVAWPSAMDCCPMLPNRIHALLEPPARSGAWCELHPLMIYAVPHEPRPMAPSLVQRCPYGPRA